MARNGVVLAEITSQEREADLLQHNSGAHDAPVLGRKFNDGLAFAEINPSVEWRVPSYILNMDGGDNAGEHARMADGAK